MTVGLNYKPPVPDTFKGFVIRPEFRIDDELGGAQCLRHRQSRRGASKTQETVAIDFVLPF